MSESTLIVIVSLSVLVGTLYGASPVAAVASFVRKMWANPQVAELLRFLFLGTIMDAGRRIGETLLTFSSSRKTLLFLHIPPTDPVQYSVFVVKAVFGTREFAYDWVLNYLDHHRVWNESRSFKVVARNASSRPNASSSLGKIDGHPDAIYEPASETSSLFCWRGYWISVVSFRLNPRTRTRTNFAFPCRARVQPDTLTMILEKRLAALCRSGISLPFLGE
jgi:hypothetical protein